MFKINPHKRSIGLNFDEDGKAALRVWAPKAGKLEVEVNAAEKYPLQDEGYGYFYLENHISQGDRYALIIDGVKKFPDPASLYQPEGVHESSAAIDQNEFDWGEEMQPGIPQEKLLVYEIHTGTFSEEGTFEGIIQKLDYLKELGINCIELMPVAQFPGERNWGYDGVYPFAVQNSYGGPAELKKLVKACHREGIAIILDVVYNHLGPEGNYLPMFGHYFTDKYKTPWGSAINFDDAWCDGVRHYFIENALMWLRDFRFDGLRLDAVHAIKDLSPRHFLPELSEKVEELDRITGRKSMLIAETDLNDTKIIRSRENCGYGIDAQWCDEFHHALHAMITGEKKGYYADFGEVEHLVKSLKDAYVYNGVFSPHRNKIFGSSTREIPSDKFVVFSQNHDQVGNRMLGDRLSALIPPENLKPIAALTILSPYIPMLFMGEEYGERNPFLYFTSHSDSGLIEAVRKGRTEEFSDFMQEGMQPPDPHDEDTFRASKLNWKRMKEEQSADLMDFYKKLIHLKKQHPVFENQSRQGVSASRDGERKVILYSNKHKEDRIFIICNFEAQEEKIILQEELPENMQSIYSRRPEEKLTEKPAVIRLKPHSVAIYYTVFKRRS